MLWKELKVRTVRPRGFVCCTRHFVRDELQAVSVDVELDAGRGLSLELTPAQATSVMLTLQGIFGKAARQPR